MKYIKIALLSFVLVLVTSTATMAQIVQNPQSGSIGLEGQVPGPGPDQGAFITTPQNGDSFTTTPITVQGSCGVDLLVQIYRNGIFAGSVFCDEDGSFSLQVDLIIGQNDLVARVFDALNQQGPDSNTVSVTYQTPQIDLPPAAADRFILTSAFGARGVDPDKQLIWPLAISGGSPPYAVSINWGNGSDELLSLSDSGDFNIEHSYALAGTYIVVVKATDSEGRLAFLQLAVVVNGPAAAGVNQQDTGQIGALVRREYIIWPLYVLTVLAVINYWLGRRAGIHRSYTRKQPSTSPENPATKILK